MPAALVLGTGRLNEIDWTVAHFGQYEILGQNSEKLLM